MPLNDGHINFINYVRCEIKRRSGVDVKAAFLEYSSSIEVLLKEAYAHIFP